MLYRSRRRNSERRQGFPSTSSDDANSNRHPDQGHHLNKPSVSPDPVQHARALVESFGARTALQIAQVNAQLTSPSGSYWTDVLDNVVDAWGRYH